MMSADGTRLIMIRHQLVLIRMVLLVRLFLLIVFLSEVYGSLTHREVLPMPSMKTSSECLAAADEALTAKGVNVNASSLRSQVEVDHGSASRWLRQRRMADTAVPHGESSAFTATFVPSIVEPIWLRCAQLAEQKRSRAHLDEWLAAEDVLKLARQSQEIADKRATAAGSKVAQLTEARSSEAAVADLRAFRDRWTDEAESAREAARAAKALADGAVAAQTRAEAESAALREVMAALRPPGGES